MSKLVKETLQQELKLRPAEWIDGFLSYVQMLGGGAAVWSLPESNEVHLLADLSGGEALGTFELQDLKEGFLIAPFNSNQHKNIHLKADFQISIQFPFKEQQDAPIISQWKIDKLNKKEGFINHIKTSKKQIEFPTRALRKSTDKAAYIATVEKGVNAIKEELFFKIVPSKINVKAHNNDINIGKAFINARLRYKNAFINLSSTPHTGFWFGASPETLIENVQGQYFKTVALAGTQAASEKAISETAWTQKEIEEQAYVSRYIINCFKKIRLREYIEIGPKTVQAGNLLHLKTSYKVNTAELNFPELASVMLGLLHPTSAVCGMPKAAAIPFLAEEESHDRAYYSGYLGPVQQDGNTHLFVNLRCCEISEEQVSFYAGAGITEDSVSEKEWLETEMKCKVLADIVFQSNN